MTDERSAFEVWMKGLPGYPYAGKFADRMWQGWQARAELAAAPVAWAGYTSEQIVDACDAAGIGDESAERLVMALKGNT